MGNEKFTLEEFLEKVYYGDLRPHNAWVREPGFKSLYVRKSRRFLGGITRVKRLDIASVEAVRPGAGCFTALVRRLLQQGIPLYIECVHNERFAAKLLRMGFKLSPSDSNSLYRDEPLSLEE